MLLPHNLLLTGFAPFGGDSFNPSGHAAAELDGASAGPGWRVRGLVLPVAGAEA